MAIDMLFSKRDNFFKWMILPDDVNLKPPVYKAEMALAATLLPSGRVRSVMARTTLGFARAGSFTSSDTWMNRTNNNHYFSG